MEGLISRYELLIGWDQNSGLLSQSLWAPSSNLGHGMAMEDVPLGTSEWLEQLA